MTLVNLLVIVGVGSVVLGRKDVTAIARFTGRLTGQAAGYISAMRSKFSAFTETSELTDLHREVRGTLSQLEAIRHDLQYGGSMSSVVANRALSVVLPAGNMSSELPASNRQPEALASSDPAQYPRQPMPLPLQQQQQQQLNDVPNSVKRPRDAATSSPPAALDTAALAGTATQHPSPPEYTRGVGQAQLFPALTAVHFSAGGDVGGDTPLVGDARFDSNAYAAYQQLFDVPGGSFAPAFSSQRQQGALDTTAVAEQQVRGSNQQREQLPSSDSIRYQPAANGIEEQARGSRPEQHEQHQASCGSVPQSTSEQNSMAQQFSEFLKTPEAHRILSAAVRHAADRREDQPGD